MTAFNAIPVLPVRNLAAAVAYYLEVLGFTKAFQFEKYAGVEYGEVKLHLWEGARKPAGSAEAYLLCDEVDAYFAEITGRGARTLNEPRDYPYGMRDFNLEDPDGNILTFGCEVKG